MPDGQVMIHATRDPGSPSAYKTVRLRVPDRFVQPDAETLRRRSRRTKSSRRRRSPTKPPGPNGQDASARRCNSTVSEAFGTRRTFNGKLASIHRGLDYHAQPGTPVLAANCGNVVLARDLFYEGNCVIIDHGQQFMTLYMHLSKHPGHAKARRSRRVRRLGLSGATGRATGPHLHVAVRWQGAYLDPAQLWTLTLPTLP